MGTNYYWHDSPPCTKCGRPFERRHIGKSSGGWVFALHIYPDDGIHELEDWERLWATGGEILDEYGRRCGIGEMRALITHREWEGGLRRSEVGDHCIKHGAGTWDCWVGRFS